MKKCVMCRAQIELMVPMTVCSGGLGNISEVIPEPEEEAKPSTSDAALSQGPFLNNGGRDTSNDIQKLQQQLQDIKEQVRTLCSRSVPWKTLNCVFLTFSDYVSCLLRSPEKHDFPVRSRLVPDVRGPNDGMPDL